MAIFKKKETKKEENKEESKPLQALLHERILTAEGWRRRMVKRSKKAAAK